MFRNRYVLMATVLVVLIIGNIIVQIYNGWGLITVKVTDAPLSKVLKSIEWQGWVKIYSNVPPDTKVSMFVDHVPLAEAMETLAANVSVPVPDDQGAPGGGGPGGPPPAAPGGNAQAGGTPPAPASTGAPAGGPGNGGGGFGGGGGGRRQGGGGGGGFGGGADGGGGGPRERGATWNLAFFVAPTSAAVKEEINDFVADNVSDDNTIFNYATPLGMVSTDDDVPASDPRLQTWPGMSPALTAPPPAFPQRNGGNANGGPGGPAGGPPPATDPAATPAAADDGPPTVQTYLRAFARASNIWILAPTSWAPEVSTPPAASSSISSAIRHLVNSAHGAVTEVIVLRVGRGGRGGRGGGFADMDATEIRIDNDINGLPIEYQAPMRDQLQQSVKQLKDIQLAPDDQKPQLFRAFFQAHRGNGNNGWRMSPEKRAQRYARLVSNRETAQGKK